jgi:hypothetical protein
VTHKAGLTLWKQQWPGRAANRSPSDVLINAKLTAEYAEIAPLLSWRTLPMLKKLMLISATAALFLVGPAPKPLSAADYKHSGCSDAAKAQFPYDHAARKFSSVGARPVENLQEIAQIRLSELPKGGAGA